MTEIPRGSDKHSTERQPSMESLLSTSISWTVFPDENYTFRIWPGREASEFSHCELWDHTLSPGHPRSRQSGPYRSQLLTPSLWGQEFCSRWGVMGIRDRVLGQPVPKLTVLFLQLGVPGLAGWVAPLLKASIHILPQQTSQTPLLLCPCKPSTQAKGRINIPWNLQDRVVCQTIHHTLPWNTSCILSFNLSTVLKSVISCVFNSVVFLWSLTLFPSTTTQIRG